MKKPGVWRLNIGLFDGQLDEIGDVFDVVLGGHVKLGSSETHVFRNLG